MTLTKIQKSKVGLKGYDYFHYSGWTFSQIEFFEFYNSLENIKSGKKYDIFLSDLKMFGGFFNLYNIFLKNFFELLKYEEVILAL